MTKQEDIAEEPKPKCEYCKFYCNDNPNNQDLCGCKCHSLNYFDHSKPKVKPSEIINDLVTETEFDYRDSCGANNCECYDNSVKIDAIIKFLDKLYE